MKSKKEIGTALLQKGISSEIAKRAMEICYEEMGEEEAIRKILRKKKFDPNKAEEAQMQISIARFAISDEIPFCSSAVPISFLLFTFCLLLTKFSAYRTSSR